MKPEELKWIQNFRIPEILWNKKFQHFVLFATQTFEKLPTACQELGML